MPPPASARRGQPIVALLAIIMVWTSARVALWNTELVAVNSGMKAAGHSPVVPARGGSPAATVWADVQLARKRRPAIKATALPRSPVSVGVIGQSRTGPNAGHESPAQWRNLFMAPAPRPRVGSVAQAHSALPWAAPVRRDTRWSIDQWLLIRGGGGVVAQAPGAASYGASQAGAIARYRLDSDKLHGSYAFLRTSFAIDAPGKDKELALGFGIRPVPKLPLRMLAEARLHDSNRGPMRARPVVMVITEVPWRTLPAGWRLEAYGQAGYAGGSDATAFFDAQALVDRSVGNAMGGSREVRVGAGLWAGGQKGAARLDFGPRISLPLDLGVQAPARIALDWRFRVAGNASPPSGPALTLASSF